MNKLKNEIEFLKIQINSTYGKIGSFQEPGISRYDELLKKKNRYFKIQNRILKIKRLYE